MSAGSIVVSLLLKTGSFETDTKRAEKSLANLKKTASNIGTIVGAAFVGFSVAAIASINKSIDVLAKLDDMAQKTGSSVENLSKLQQVATQYGQDFETVNSSLNKLSKNLADVDDESSNVTKSLKALGISQEFVKSNDTSAVFVEIAKRLQTYEDGNRKVQIGNELMGKSFADLLPYINDVADNVDRFTGVSAEAARQAGKFKDDLGSLKVQFDKMVMAITSDVLPALNDLIEKIKEAYTEGGLLKAFLMGIGTLGKNALFGSEAESKRKRALMAIPNEINELATKLRNDINKSAPLSFIDRKQIELDIQYLANEANNLKRELGIDQPTKKTDKITLAPEIKDTKDDPSKRILDNQLKNIEIAISREEDLLDSRNKFIELYNRDNLLSINDYYSSKYNAQQENLEKTLALYDQEIVALKKAQGKADKKTDKVELQGKINELLAKEQKLNEEITIQTTVDSIEKQKALRSYADSVSEVNASILELKGNLGAAAAIRFDIQNRDLTQRFSAEGNSEAQKALDIQRAYIIAQAEANSLDEKSSRILDNLANQEARITLSQKLGSLSEISALIATDEARGNSVNALRALVEEYERLAIASGNPKLLQDADNLKLKLEELEASSHQLADTFSKIFEDSASSAFEQFIDGTLSARDAFRAFADDVVKQINRIIAQQLAQSLFGGGGSGSSGVFSGIIGSVFGAMFSGSSAGVMPSAGAGAYSIDANPYLNYGGARALGGPVTSGKTYLVGENGPEIFRPTGSGSIVPNNKIGGGGMSVTNIFHVSGQTDMRSQQQIAAAAYSGAVRAAKRNG